MQLNQLKNRTSFFVVGRTTKAFVPAAFIGSKGM
jgi:hypothetical protein